MPRRTAAFSYRPPDADQNALSFGDELNAAVAKHLITQQQAVTLLQQFADDAEFIGLKYLELQNRLNGMKY